MDANQNIRLSGLSASQAMAMEYSRIQDRNEWVILNLGLLANAFWKGLSGQYSVSIIEAQLYINHPRHKNTWSEHVIQRTLSQRKISLIPTSQNTLKYFNTQISDNNRHDKRTTGLPFTVFNARTPNGQHFAAQILNGLPAYILHGYHFTPDQISGMKETHKKHPLTFDAAQQLIDISKDQFDQKNQSAAHILGESMNSVKFAMIQLPGWDAPHICAAKKLSPDKAFNNENAVKQEIELQNKSGCAPAVYGYTDTVTAEGKKQFIIFMEIAEGSSATEIKKQSNPYQQLRLAKAALEAMATMHKNGVYHRDVKADNIFFNKQGKARFIDYGLASSEAKQPVTHRKSSYLATNMAPECTTNQQLSRQERHYIDSAAADIFAMGAFFTQFLGDRQILNNHYWVPLPSGSPPDCLEKATALIRRSVGEQYKGLPIRNGQELQQIIDNDLNKIALQPDIKALLSRMLQVDPSQRITIDNAMFEMDRLILKHQQSQRVSRLSSAPHAHTIRI